MTTLVRFYGASIIQETGLPDPYHVYQIWESPAPWAGPNFTVATISPVTSGSEVPDQIHFLANKDLGEDATNRAREALRNLPPHQGLTEV